MGGKVKSRHQAIVIALQAADAGARGSDAKTTTRSSPRWRASR